MQTVNGAAAGAQAASAQTKTEAAARWGPQTPKTTPTDPRKLAEVREDKLDVIQAEGKRRKRAGLLEKIGAVAEVAVPLVLGVGAAVWVARR